MTSCLNSIEDQLKAELSLKDSRLKELRIEMSQVQKDLERIVACLSALGVRSKPSKNGAKMSRPCAGQKEVAETVLELLSANGPMEADDLIELTKSRIAATGKNLVGFGLRFAEVRALHLKETSQGILSLADGQPRNAVAG